MCICIYMYICTDVCVYIYIKEKYRCKYKYVYIYLRDDLPTMAPHFSTRVDKRFAASAARSRASSIVTYSGVRDEGQGAYVRVQGAGFRVQGAGFRV